MNYKLVQRQLDIAAEDIEKQGHTDLADKIDVCNSKLEKASEEERKVIASVLQKIDREADRREAAKKPKAKENPNQLAAHRRKSASRERIKKLLAARRLERELLADLNLSEEVEVVDNDEAELHQGRKGRIRAAKLAALKREQARLEAE